MKKHTVLTSLSLLLVCAVLCSGCAEDDRNRYYGLQTQPNNPPPPPPPPSAVILTVSPDNHPKVLQGASLLFAGSVKIDGVTSNADPSELSYSLLTNVGTITNTGVFTASLTEVGKSDLRVVFTRGTHTANVTTDVEVVDTVSGSAAPKRAILQPTPARLLNGEIIALTLSVEREDGITVTVDPASGVYSAVLSDGTKGTLTLLNFEAHASNTGFTDIYVTVMMAGQTLITDFPKILEVVAAPPLPPPPAGAQFNSVDMDTVGHITSEVYVNGTNTGRHGLVVWHKVTSVSGNLAAVKLTAYFGPFANDDNTLDPSWQPWFWRGYTNGAQTGKNGTFYTPLPFTEVAGSNGYLWEVVIPTFPTTGTLSYGITLNGDDVTHSTGVNVYMGGFPSDSSYNIKTSNLEATYDAASGEVATTTAPAP